jgi:hypothetical protein
MILFWCAAAVPIAAVPAQLALKKVETRKVLVFPKLTIQVPSSIPAGAWQIDVNATIGAHDGNYWVFFTVDQGDVYYFATPFGPSSSDVSVEALLPLSSSQSSPGDHVLYAQLCADDYETDCDDWVQAKFVAE